MYYLINIGSNLGDRRLNLSRAMRAVGMEFGEFEMSHAVESAPFGFSSPHRFLNVGMLFSSELEPEEVLDKLQTIEKQLGSGSHRNADGSYCDRLIDIDIVAADNLVVDTPRLTLPHPGLPERRFFLEPLMEIAPQWVHPVNGLTARQMLAKLPAEPAPDAEADSAQPAPTTDKQ